MKSLSLLTLFLIAFCSASGQSSPERPNVIFILVDDLGYGDLSIQGGKDIQTPAIDKLFKDGMQLTNYYANSSVCSPSRASLLTGRYPDMVGVPGVIRPYQSGNWGYFDPKAITLPQLMNENGYATSLIGKWHLGLEEENHPNERGFGHFKGTLGGMMDYNTHLRFKKKYMRHNKDSINPTGHATDLFTDWAIDYIKEAEGKEEPFFMYLAYTAPHDPIQPPKEWLAKVQKREKGIDEKRANIVALIEHLDDNIGRLYKHLEKKGMLENTLIFFASDNGGVKHYAATMGDLKGEKGDMYEGGIKVPACATWKGKIKAGSSSDNLMLLMDMLPTICSITNTSFSHQIDGMDVTASLMGEEQVTDDRLVVWVRREGFKYGGKAYYAIRNKGHKLLQNTPYSPLEMYEVGADKSETKPLELEGDVYKLLFRKLSRHINTTGSIPWGKR